MTTAELKEEEVVDPEKIARAIAQLKAQQNMPKAILAGIVAALVCGVLWAMVTLMTGYQIGWMAIGIGFAVGYAVRLGRGLDKRFGILGALLSLAGCLLGNFFVIVGLVANEVGMGYLDALQVIDYAEVPNLMLETGSPIDLLFFAIALHQGYRISFRTLSASDIAQATA
jgi:hypothetical protein